MSSSKTKFSFTIVDDRSLIIEMYLPGEAPKRKIDLVATDGARLSWHAPAQFNSSDH